MERDGRGHAGRSGVRDRQRRVRKASGGDRGILVVVDVRRRWTSCAAGREAGPATWAWRADYAWLAEASYVFEWSGRARWRARALEVSGQLIDLFHDDVHGGFFTTGKDAEQLVVRPEGVHRRGGSGNELHRGGRSAPGAALTEDPSSRRP